MKILSGVFLVLLAAPGLAQDVQLSKREKAEVETIQKAHYQNLLQTWQSLEFSAADRGNPAVAVSCRLSSITAPTDLPARNAQPGAFAQLQTQLSAAVSDCQSRMTYTPQTLRDIQDQFLSLLSKDSQTAFCKTDADCRAIAIDRGGCEAGPVITIVSSELTDNVFFICLRRYLPGLLAQVRASIRPDLLALECDRFVMADADAV